jgi:hypothetical protein
VAGSLDVELEVEKGGCYARAKGELENRSKISNKKA